MQDVSLKALLEAGCHFGHKADRWHPKAKKFIFAERDGVHIIDLVKTKSALVAAGKFVYETAKSGKTILFIGTKRQAASLIAQEAGKAGAPYISKRWIGGFLTNWEQVHASLEKIRRLKDEEAGGVWKKYPKHERVKLGRYVAKLEQFYGGVLSLVELPDAVFIVDVKREEVAVREATRMNRTIVAIVDTNSDPTPVTYPIPANDDAVRSIAYLVHYMAEAYREGREAFEKEAATQKVSQVDKANLPADGVEKEEAEKVVKVSEVAKVSKVGQQVEKVSEVVKVEKGKVEKVSDIEVSNVPNGVQDKKEKVTEKSKKKRGRPKKTDKLT